MNEFQVAIIKEFVQPDERVRAKIRLRNFQSKGTMDRNIQ